MKAINPVYKKTLLKILRLVIGFILIGLAGALIRPNGILRGYWLVVLPVLGIGILVWGVWKRQADPIFLGCVLSGMGLSAILTSPTFQVVPEVEGVRVFLYALGVSFILTTLLTGLFTEKTSWWALIIAILVILVALFFVEPAAAKPIRDNPFFLV